MKHKTFFIQFLIFSLLLPGCSDQSAPEESDAALPAWESWANSTQLQSEELDGWIDTEFVHAILEPAFDEGSGPNVCVDEAHFNYHTARGIYSPFAELILRDGYRVTPFLSRFTADALKDCQILLIANAQAETNTIGFGSPASNWGYPHASAFTRDELEQIILWVREGGALFLIADHAPWPAAVSDLAMLLGVHMFDGYTYATAKELDGTDLYSGDIVFGSVDEEVWRRAVRLLEDRIDLDLEAWTEDVLANPGVLAPHPIVNGRNSAEHVEWVDTFSGQAFQASADWEPILILGPNAVSKTILALNFKDSEWGDGPIFSAANWLQGATRKLDKGRIAILGEAAMCSAQFDDGDGALDSPRIPYGFNAPRAPQNAQFCLNAMHWLAGLIAE